MPKYDDEVKYQALSMLHAGDEPRMVSAKLEVPVFTIVKWKKELAESVEQGGVSTLVDLDRVVLGEIITKVVEADPTLAEAADSITNKLSSMDRLSEELHSTAIHINSQVKKLAICAESAPELIMLAEVICEIQKAFFNSQSTNVNVQNNFSNKDDSAYSAFLSDTPSNA